MNILNIKSDSDNGFTLVEAMIALVVLLIGILGVMGMQYYAVTGNSSSREMRVATNLALESMEQAKSTPYTNLVSGSDTPFSSSEISLTAGVSSYSRRWWVVSDCIALNTTTNDDPCNAAIVASCAANGDPDGSTTVAVSAIRTRSCWQDKNSDFHSVTIDSLRWNENVVP